MFDSVRKSRAKGEPAPQSIPPRPEPLVQGLRALWWKEAFVSLWAPVTLFGLVLLAYIFVIELWPGSLFWSRPLIRAFGLFMLGYFFVLLGLRAASSEHRRRVALRAEAQDLTDELRRVCQANAQKLDLRAVRKLLDQADALDILRVAGDTQRLRTEIDRLDAAGEKFLGPLRKRSSWAFIIGIAKALAVAMLIRTVLIEPYKIPSSSMIPTLEIGDQIFVHKFIYGVRIPFLNKVPFVIVREPRRGDVVVFENPHNASIDLIKRVVGLPGDKIEIRNKLLYVNGQEQPLKVEREKEVIHDQNAAGVWETMTVTRLEETLDGRPHPVLHFPDRASEGVSTTVPPGHVFVLGDNRDNSADSRLGFGNPSLGIVFVPYGHIKGKAMVIWLCLGWDGLFSSLFDGTGLRTERFFLPVR